MQGFEMMLKAMGVDPQKMAEDAMAKFGPELEKFKVSVVETIKTDVIQPMAEAFGERLVALNGRAFQLVYTKLDSLDDAIKALNPGYTPLVVDLGKVTNPDTPSGGPVDMTQLDTSKIGTVEAQEALAGLGGQVDVSSLEGGNGQGDQGKPDKAAKAAAKAAAQAAEAEAAANLAAAQAAEAEAAAALAAASQEGG